MPLVYELEDGVTASDNLEKPYNSQNYSPMHVRFAYSSIIATWLYYFPDTIELEMFTTAEVTHTDGH